MPQRLFARLLGRYNASFFGLSMLLLENIIVTPVLPNLENFVMKPVSYLIADELEFKIADAENALLAVTLTIRIAPLHFTAT